MINRKIKNLFNIFKIFFSKYFFGFYTNHYYLNGHQIKIIKNLLLNENPDIVLKYEENFSEIIGNGRSISFASARMAFYVLMIELGIKDGDEVIIQAANCSVMINAILKTGAKPVFVDIDIDTLGTSYSSIVRNITNNTKLIVAQHSFGIPCDIEKIKMLTIEKGIFLLEDCALSFDSKINNIKLGNFGDAAIFSTDYSKPINTIIGGILYTNNNNLYQKIKSNTSNIKQLSSKHKKNIYNQFIIQKVFFAPNLYGKLIFLNYFKSFLLKILNINSSVLKLDDDYSLPQFSNNKYPYPSGMPSFLAQLGIFELQMWDSVKKNRIQLLKKYIQIFEKKKLTNLLPKKYFDISCEIVPLRFVFYHTNASLIRQKLSYSIHTEAIWFLSPIIATKDYRIFNYVEDTCPIVEYSCNSIVNLPITYENIYNQFLISLINKIL
jgi:dTDP-4-amino-4,6-dideoxygalactose transaminase